ncbi:MAG: alpha/beta hydrolase [Lachnospiraceae bacterium]|nr:alpha/beta hydrolase [Lachnospiraceae bacterium]
MARLNVDKQIKHFVKEHITKQEKLDEKEKMSPMMQALKAVHSVATAGESVSEEDLKKQRTGMDLFSKLVTLPVNTSSKSVKVKDINCEWTVSDTCHDKKHVIMYCHGGGYTCGSINYARVIASKLALHTGLSVFSFEYRLSPENPYPAAVDDAVTVWNYLMQLGYGARDVVIVGDSAGGNLALLVCQKLKANERLMPGAMVLMSPWTDMTMSGDSYEECKEIDPILTAEYIKACRGAYAGSNVDFALPQYSPLYGEFDDYPPTFVQVGSNEILKSDSERLVEALKEADVMADIEIYEDSWHVFQQMPLRKSWKAMNSIGEFIYKVI